MEIEKDLIVRAQNGDKAALGIIYENFVDRIYRYIYIRIQNKEVAEDLTSKVFMRVIEYLHTFKIEKRFDSWLFTISKNVLIDYYKANKTMVDLSIVEETVTHSTQEEQLLKKVLLDELKGGMNHLNDEEKEIIQLSYFFGFEDKEIAQTLNKTHGNVRIIKFRALQKLKKIINTKSYAKNK